VASNRLSQPQVAPLVLTVPGIDNSGPGHWQTRWERELPDCHRAELGMWDRPHRNTWVNQLNLAVRAARLAHPARPIVLAAHSLGCLAVAWWAKLEHAASGELVDGALLVAPPEVDFFPRDERLSGFAPAPADPLPFPATVVASRDDPYVSLRAVARMARLWGARFIDIGEHGHINAASQLGSWRQGQELLAQLVSVGGRTDSARRVGGASRDAHGREAPSSHE